MDNEKISEKNKDEISDNHTEKDREYLSDILEKNELKKRKFRLHKKTIIFGGIAVVVALVVLQIVLSRFAETKVITSSQLVKAVNVSNLSTAEFVYNGIAEKRERGSDDVEYYVAYDAKVKVGINMKDIKFEIDDKQKTVTPILPEIKINTPSVDTSNISYMPDDADVNIKEVIQTCENDVKYEAGKSEKLFSIAEDNLKSTIKALLLPILKDADYKLVWSDAETEE